jgi:hypothetical protein
MSPKEKAEDLWLKYYELVDDIYSTEAAKKNAKMYALKAVDEILNNVLVGIDLASTWGNYWQEVKQEIELL